MAILQKSSGALNKKGNKTDEQIAQELIDNNDVNGIEEIAKNLYNGDGEICTDSLNILYLIGKQKPELVEIYIFEFIKLVQLNNEKLIYKSLLALSTLIHHKTQEIYENCISILDAIETGDDETVDVAIEIISVLATKDNKYNMALFPYLVNHLRTSSNEHFTQFAEHILQAATPENKQIFTGVLMERQNELHGKDKKRIDEILKELEAI